MRQTDFSPFIARAQTYAEPFGRKADEPFLICHREERSRFDKLRAPSLSRGWIAAPSFLGLAMTREGVK
jgi:hypothetical protein